MKKYNIRLKKKQKRQVALLTFIILIASIMAIMMLTPIFNITEIKVHGNSIVLEKDIVKSSGIVKGVNIFSVSMGKAKKYIESIGYIDECSVKRKFPGTIDITVVEAAGVGYITSQKGYIIITADGRCIDLIAKNEENKNSKDKKGFVDIKSIPQITGIKSIRYKIGKKIESDDNDRLNALFECLHEFCVKGFIFDMQNIDISSMSDIKFTYNNGKLLVRVGSEDKVGYKMECFKSILNEIGDDAEGYVDLERLTYKKTKEKTTQKQ